MQGVCFGEVLVYEVEEALSYICFYVSAESQAFCPIRLPQNEPWWSPCKDLRQIGLGLKRKHYGIIKATPNMPFDRLRKSIPEYVFLLATTPFLAAHTKFWAGQAGVLKAGQIAYNTAHQLSPQIMTMKEYADLRNFFRNYVSSPLNPLRVSMKFASDHEPFQDYTQFISDNFFAEQRLAGMNPMTIQKITLSDSVGTNYNKLKTKLNPKFNFVEAVNRVLGGITDECSLRNAIENGRLFVLYHSLSSTIKAMPDRTDNETARTMWQYLAPIAIFASKSVENCENKLVPVAIQMDDKQDAKVFTPQDGDNWMLAKLDAQLTDLGCSQIIEHLSKIHFVMEGICLSLERQLSNLHPLYDIMRFHCRGVFTANTLGGPVLLAENQPLDKILPYGYLGTHALVKEAGTIVDWNDLDLHNNVKRRGVDDKENLPYYPYRDDGTVIADVLNKFVIDYVNSFYLSDNDVLKDVEVQRFASEITIRGFPNSFPSKASLIETFSRILWLQVGQHTAINYPLSDYATYVPNESTKLYDDTRVDNNVFNPNRMHNRGTASDQTSLILTLSSMRFDRLFDYGSSLGSSQGKIVVNYFHNKLAVDIEPILKKRNEDRKDKGHLTYPYMQPSWLTNGIQA